MDKNSSFPKLPVFDEDDKRCLRIMSGIEERAKKRAGKPWKVKTVGCNLCGECCMRMKPDWRYGVNDKGWCSHLVYNNGWDNGTTKLGYVCDFGVHRPASCSTSDDSDKEYCCIEWKAS